MTKKTKMTQETLDDWINTISSMDHEALAKLWRFAPSGHPVFDSTLPLFEVFNRRFNSFGGMTPEISKRIGWHDEI